MLTYGNGRTLTKSYDQDYAIDAVVSSAATAALAGHLLERYPVSVRRACRVMGQARWGWYYRKTKKHDGPLLKRI